MYSKDTIFTAATNYCDFLVSTIRNLTGFEGVFSSGITSVSPTQLNV